MSKATITEVDAAARKGLEAARELVDTTELEAFLDLPEATYEKVYANFIIIAIGLSSLSYKDKKQVILMLERFMKRFRDTELQPFQWRDFSETVQ